MAMIPPIPAEIDKIFPKKRFKHPLRGLAYIALGAGLLLHSLEFGGGLYFLNKVKSGEEEIIINLQEEGIEAKNGPEVAKYLADKIIEEIKGPKEYFFAAGLKLAARFYLSRNPQ